MPAGIGLRTRHVQPQFVILPYSAPHEYTVSKAHALAGYYCHLS